jgi:hypothetical protein
MWLERLRGDEMENRLSYSAIPVAQEIESVLIGGDLSKLTPEQRVNYYKAVCDSVGLNPLTRPFDYITLNGKLTLYAKKDATDQLRKRDGVSITKLEREVVNDICLVTAYAQTVTRSDASTGAVSIKGLSGDALANAMMKAETKAKRRVTLSICGLGLLDETEVETTVSTAVPTIVNVETGEIVEDVPAVPLDNIPDMSLELAMSEQTSKGDLYGDLPNDKLALMFNAISKKVPHTDDHKRKMVAIQTILESRASGSGA